MSDKKLSNKAQRVQAALAEFGLDLVVMEFPESTRTAQEAAEAVGCQVGQIVKSLIFQRQPSGQAILIAASGSNRVNEKQIKVLLGEKIVRADAEFVRQVSGYPIGGVPPLAHDQKIETIIDQDLLQYEQVWAAAGTPNAVFRLSPQQLVRITNGRLEKIT
ncbi:MAG: YbaK/EbsC family protein [Anaerolineaceae bacterium]|jgi:prolyl-tRNA editing enzyme YbaK/EbsC (Cys-tRNA(Pro) deacylase)|nr:YbaK/EbsC family protein [Anaerolineaceae bacterium]